MTRGSDFDKSLARRRQFEQLNREGEEKLEQRWKQFQKPAELNLGGIPEADSEEDNELDASFRPYGGAGRGAAAGAGGLQLALLTPAEQKLQERRRKGAQSRNRVADLLNSESWQAMTGQREREQQNLKRLKELFSIQMRDVLAAGDLRGVQSDPFGTLLKLEEALESRINADAQIAQALRVASEVGFAGSGLGGRVGEEDLPLVVSDAQEADEVLAEYDATVREGLLSRWGGGRGVFAMMSPARVEL